MNIAKSQDIILIHRNPLHSYTLTMKNRKEKLRKQSHSTKRMKYWGISLPKETKDLYAENCKTLMKKIKDNTNSWRNIPSSWIRTINIVKISIQPKTIYRFNAIHNKLPIVFFTELEQVVSQFVWKHKKSLVYQSILEKEEWNWRNQPVWLQTIPQSYNHQYSMVLAQRQKYGSMEQNIKPRDKSMHLWISYLGERKKYKMEKRQYL